MFLAAGKFDPTRLAIGLGGLSATELLCECRSGVAIASGTSLASWSDFRGSAAPAGAGAMSPAGSGNAPTQAAAFNSPVVTALSNKTLAQALNATILASGNGTVACIGTLGTVSSVMAGVSGNNSDLLVTTTAGGNYSGTHGTADITVDTGVADSGTVVRAVWAAQTGTAASAAVGNHAIQTGTLTNSTNTSNKYVIAQGGGSHAATATVQAFLAGCWSTIFTAAHEVYLTLCGQIRYGAVAST